MKTASQLAILVLATFNLSAATLYVSLENTHPLSPYETWDTAATNIQDAVDAAKNGDTVLVTNGAYAMGNRDISLLDTNYQPPLLVSIGPSRVVVTNAIRLESVNGPLVTIVYGDWGGVRCVYLGTNAVLSGFTLRGGLNKRYGGGVFSEPSGVVTNCTLIGNTAGIGNDDPGAGGGVYGGTLYNCTLTGNGAQRGYGRFRGSGGGAYRSTLYNCTVAGNGSNLGGGVSDSTLYNCTVTGNSASDDGGGAYRSTLYNCTVTVNDGVSLFGTGGAANGTLYNCLITDNNGGSGGFLYGCTVVGNNGGVTGTLFNSIVYYNSGGNYDTNTVMNYCCTTPLPTNGVGNITGSPLFMDFAAGDYRLWEGSPCIDAGTNLMVFSATVTNEWGEVSAIAYAHEPTDVLGNTRFIDGNFDGTVGWDIGAYEFNSFPPPRFASAPQLTANGWCLNITGAPNKWVRLQRSSDLKNWERLYYQPYTFFMGSEGVKQVNDRDMGPKVMFYRVVVEQ